MTGYRERKTIPPRGELRSHVELQRKVCFVVWRGYMRFCGCDCDFRRNAARAWEQISRCENIWAFGVRAANIQAFTLFRDPEPFLYVGILKKIFILSQAVFDGFSYGKTKSISYILI